MKKLYGYLRNILAIISLSVSCQLSTFGQTCPNIPVTYYAGTTPDGVGYWPNKAYNSDGTLPPQSGDGNGNLIVTWPHPEQGDVYYITYDGQTYWAVNAPVNVAGPSFVAAPSFLCNSQTGTYTISDVCGTTYTWAAPAGWSINGGGNIYSNTSSQSVNITAPSTGSGTGTVTVTSNNNAAISTSVWFGVPTISAPNITGSCRYPVYIYTASPIDAYSYSWSINNSSLSLTSYGSQCQVVLRGTQTGLYMFNLSLTITSGSCSLVTTANEYYYSSAQSPCSVDDQRQAANNQNDNQADSETNVEVNTPYPNPANNQFSMIVNGINHFALLDLTGKVFRQFSGDGVISIDTHDLAAGLYILSISNNEETIRKKVMVAH